MQHERMILFRKPHSVRPGVCVLWAARMAAIPVKNCLLIIPDIDDKVNGNPLITRKKFTK